MLGRTYRKLAAQYHPDKVAGVSSYSGCSEQKWNFHGSHSLNNEINNDCNSIHLCVSPGHLVCHSSIENFR